MKRKTKLTPDQRAFLADLDRRAAENLPRARQHVARALKDLEEKRAAAARGEIELDPGWSPLEPSTAG
jgi:hypothetical protein